MSLTYREIHASGRYWMYSKRGPHDNRKLDDYQLVSGVLSVPVPGRIARDLVGRGLCAVEASVVVLPEFRVGASGELDQVPALAEVPPPGPPPEPEADPPAPRRGFARRRKADEE